MNLRLGNLTTLKRHLLAAPLAAGTGPVAASNVIRDDVLTSIGLGVGMQIENFCQRQFFWAVGAVTVFSGDRLTYVLPRYPVIEITAVAVRDSFAESWQTATVSDAIASLDLAAGLIELAALQGDRRSEVQVTYTGGYWFDTTEDGTGEQPQAAPDLPTDLQLAWLLQCQEVWNKRDKLGINLNSKPDERVAIARLNLTEGVREMLRPHVRMQLS